MEMHHGRVKTPPSFRKMREKRVGTRTQSGRRPACALESKMM